MLKSDEAGFQEILGSDANEVFNFHTEVKGGALEKETIRTPTINIENLNKYIKFYTKVRWRDEGVEKIYRTKMVHCTKEMFESNNYPIDDATGTFFEKRLCPDPEALKDVWILRNGYSFIKDRISFNV